MEESDGAAWLAVAPGGRLQQSWDMVNTSDIAIVAGKMMLKGTSTTSNAQYFWLNRERLQNLIVK